MLINEAKLSFPGFDLVVDSIHALWCRCQIFLRNHHMKLHLQQCKGPKTNWSRLKKNGATGRHLHCKLGFPIKRTSGLVTRSILICHRYIDYLILCSIIWTQILFGLQSIVVNIWSVNKCREKFKIENNCEKFQFWIVGGRIVLQAGNDARPVCVSLPLTIWDTKREMWGKNKTSNTLLRFLQMFLIYQKHPDRTPLLQLLPNNGSRAQ